MSIADLFLKDIGVHFVSETRTAVPVALLIQLTELGKAARETKYDENKRNDGIKLIEIDLFASNIMILIINLEK